MTDTLQLDPVTTHAGLIERICLHETRTPGFPGYDEAESLKAMWFIRQMMANRVRYPRVFGNPVGITEAEIMRLPNQFPGFQTYPALTASAMKNVTDCVDLANNPRGYRHPLFLKHVQNAITVATAPAVPLDQFVPQAAGWKKQGSPSPGKRYTLWNTLQGNDYYITKMS
jgi:hypothetical protein